MTALRFRGLVQGVGFRPAVARVARAQGRRGWVRNDGDGVLVVLDGDEAAADALVERLRAELPPTARIDAVERGSWDGPAGDGFEIAASAEGRVRTAIPPDVATCAACAAEVRDPAARRHGYPFTTCAACGPRASIVLALPFDRARTTMRAFPPCPDCHREHDDPADRRFHAQTVACPRCGPTARLVVTAGGGAPPPEGDPVDAARALLARGGIVAVKGLGGYQLCCDAADEAAVARLRARKRRPAQPFALLAADLDQVRAYAVVSDAEADALRGPAHPIVLLAAGGPRRVADGVAPGQRTLGFLLPPTPLHARLVEPLGRPLVCTSGNVTGEPPCTDDDDALARLGPVADAVLVHDRPIALRMDDSVARALDGEVRTLRRSRGLAPAPLRLHPSFAPAPPLTALGGHLKVTFALARGGEVVCSPHLGDLDHPRAVAGFADALRRLSEAWGHAPARLVVDAHPEARGLDLAPTLGDLPVDVVQHHHAHAAAVLAEHGLPVDAPPALALVLDGLGWGPDGTGWGGELLDCDFRGFHRLASLPAVPLPGGDRCAREPWRNAVAHLVHALGWDALADVPHLAARRSPVLALALRTGPRASSAGRLFDAVAAVLGLHADATSFEAQAALALEALAADADAEDDGYPFGLGDLAPGWEALLRDRRDGVAVSTIAARFHEGLAQGLAAAVRAARAERPARATVALAGGVWQNAVLLRRTVRHLREDGATVLLPRGVPPNDGGLSLGQAAIAAARALAPAE